MKVLGFRAAYLGLALFLGATAGQGASAQNMNFDIASFGRRCCVEARHVSPLTFDYEEAEHAGSQAEKAADGSYIYGLQWAEERDIKEVRVRYKPGSVAEKATIQYWYLNWPFSPPEMPTIDDLRDDAWQGEWLKAVTDVTCGDSECRYTFQPLEEHENPQAQNLPGVDYRRALKVRLVFATQPALDGVQVFTGSTVEPVKVRIELGAGERERYEWKGSLSVYDGQLKDVKLWKGATGDRVEGKDFQVVTEGAPKGLLVELAAAKPSLPGSEDITIVTLEAGERTFSFAVPDLEKGPIYVPAFHAYVSTTSDEKNFSPSIVKAGAKIRERIPKEPEQSYARASKEIPTLNPAQATGHEERVFLPLAAQASWQKFGVLWGGNIFITKGGTRAQFFGEEQRLEWRGDIIRWRIGTGVTPNYRPLWTDSKLSALEDDLPVAIAKWSTEGIEYTEESFVTLLSGPLSPDDPGRSEETPAVLMVKLEARNLGSKPAMGHLWLATDPNEEVTYENGELLAQGGELVRARLKLPEAAHAARAAVPYGGRNLEGIHAEVPLAANGEGSVLILIPYIPRLSAAERARLAALDYGGERTRVVNYWQTIVARSASFDVPDETIKKFMKAVAPHIFMAVVKHPKSGLYYVQAGTIWWAMASDEGSGQALVLDALGHSQHATESFETWVRLQGTAPVPGTFTNQRGFYSVLPINVYSLNAGSVLAAMAEHYLFTRDRDWLRRTAPSMKLAADWILEQRKLTEVLDGGKKVPEYGLLPSGKLDDQDDWAHWVSVDAEGVAGITRLAEVLADIGAPEAKHYAEEAAAYKQDLRDSVIRASQRAAVVRLRDNTYVPYIPTREDQRIREFGPIKAGYYSRYHRKISPMFRGAATLEVDCGPLYLLFRGVFGLDEPLANWILDDWEDNATTSVPLGLNVHGWVDEKYWFSQGGMQFHAPRNPAPVYLRRNEIPAAIRSTYNSFVSLYYPTLNAMAEEYHEWGHTMATMIKTYSEARLTISFRDMLVREDGDALWLAGGVPRDWLAASKKIELRDAPTYFGPVSYRIEASESGIEAQVQLPTRNKLGTAWLVVRAPADRRIRAVEIDGTAWRDFDAATERIHLPPTVHPLHISVHF